MKILLATLEYTPFLGGVARYYANLAKFWPKPGGLAVLDNSRAELMAKITYPRWLPSLWNLWYYIKKEKADQVLIGQILPLGIAMFCLSILTGKTYSVFLHGMDIAWALKSKRKQYITGKILVQAEHIICSSCYAPKIVKANFPQVDPTKLHVVHPGVEVKPAVSHETIMNLRTRYGLTGKTVVLTLARLVKRKGQDTAIKAMRGLSATRPDLVYIIAGTGPDESYLRSLAAESKQVIFTGPVTEAEKWAWLELCDIFLMPSRDIAGDVEGFGIVFLEANIAGKAVIAGRSGGITDAVTDNQTGFLVDPENEKTVKDAVVRLAADKTLRDRLGEQGRARAESDFNWPGQAKKIFDILNNKP